MGDSTKKLLGLLAAAVPVSSALAVASQPAAGNETFDCSLLNNLHVGEHNFGSVAVMTCMHWPPTFGRFPFSEINDLTVMLEMGMGYQGIWEQFQSDMASEKRNSLFCTRQEAMRETVIANGAACPEAVDAEVKEELKSSGESPAIASGGYWSCVDSGEGCQCTKRNDVQHPTADMKKRPKGCKMVHKDQCYGECPRGYRPTYLLGGFRPVCTAVCGETTHPVGCGTGCASSPKNCALVVVDQVKQITALVSKVVAYFQTGHLISDAMRIIRGVAGFAMTTLKSAVGRAMEIWTNYTRDKTELGVLLSLMQFVKEAGAEAALDANNLENLLNTTQHLFLQLVDAELGWDEVDLDWMASLLSESGMEIVGAAFATLQTFRYADCELAGSQVHFSIEECGHENMVGPWGHVGFLNERARYQRINDKDTVMEWDSRDKAWKLFYMDRSSGRGRWFGWIGLGWTEMYRSAEDTQTFPTEGWRRVEGPSPLPSVVSVSAEPEVPSEPAGEM